MLVVVTVADSWLPQMLSAVMGTSITLLFPVATAIAVVRYRLYGIDRIINRTLVCGLLTTGTMLAAEILSGQRSESASPSRRLAALRVGGLTNL